MTLREFAELHRLRVRKDEDGTRHVPGGAGQIYRYDAKRMAVIVQVATHRMWSHRRRLCEDIGMAVLQDGDTEGCLTFDPTGPAQVGVALKVARVKRRRVPSEAQLGVLTRARVSSKPLRTSLASA